MANQAATQAVQARQPIDLQSLFTIESSNIADAHNKATDARGLGQITPIALQEWNQYNPKENYTPDQLFLTEPNNKISDWYANKRIPQMLDAFGIPDTVDNRLISYNAGVGVLSQVLKGKRALKPETIDYIRKYREAYNGKRQ